MNNKPAKNFLLATGITGGLLAAPTALADDWEFFLSPLFLWGVSVDGESAIEGNTAPLDLNFTDDILDNMEGVFTLHFEARKGDWVFFTEYQFIDLEPETEASIGPVAINADIDFEEDMFEIGAGWAFVNNDTTRWELIGGGRYTEQDITVDIDLQLLPPGPGLSPKIKGGDDWWMGFAGVRVLHELSDNWTFVSRIDYGYGGSDNSAGNFAFQFDYKFNDWGSVFFGGRYLDYDYDDDSYAYDAYKAGPLAGLTIRW